MKVLRFHAPGDVRVEEAPEPVCSEKEVKIRVRNCSTCGTDVKILKNGHPNITGQRVMGHEVADEVVEVGSQVSGCQIGDRVQVIAACTVRGLPRVCKGLDGSLPEPYLHRLSVRRRVFRIHDRAASGAGRSWVESDPGRGRF